MARERKPVIKEYHLSEHQPDKPQFTVYDLNGYLKKDRINTTKPHIHSFYQVIWFKNGKGKHFVDFKKYDVSDNIIFLIAKNQVHYFDHNIHYQGVLIHFNETFFIQNDNDTDFFLKYGLFNNAYRQPSCRIGKSIALVLEEYIAQIQRELMNNNVFGKEELLRSYLRSFLIQIQRKKNESDKGKGKMIPAIDKRRRQLIKFINLIENNYNKGLTVTEYAALLFISSRTLSALTGDLLNKTPSHMIQERIVMQAQRLLLHSNLTISQIAYNLGFDDPSYFVKYFKKHTNASPSEFRKLVS